MPDTVVDTSHARDSGRHFPGHCQNPKRPDGRTVRVLLTVHDGLSCYSRVSGPLQTMDNERKAKLESSYVHLNEDAPRQSSVPCPTCGLMVPTTMKACPQDGTEIAPAILGDALSATYEFIEAVGAGGMSVIYKARHRALNRLVAIKMLHGHMLSDTIIRRFQQEAKASSLLQHPNTVAVYDFGITESGLPFMVMDFVEGETLANRLKRRGTLPPRACIMIFKQVCDAVEHAHELGILHRDLKPGNIMLIESEGTPGIVKILDFGIAKIMDATDSPGHNLTQTGEVFGSPLYMSPEQCSGNKALDRRSDIYSLGCVMYECLTGTVPHRGDTVMATIVKQLNERPKPITELQPNARIPAKLEDIVDKALEKNPDKRFQSMEELKEALIELRDTENLDTAGGGKRWKHLARKVHIPQKSLWLLTVGLCVATTAVSLSFLSARTPEKQSVTDLSRFPPDSVSTRRDKFEKFRSYVDHSKITDQLLAEYLPVDIQIENLDLGNSKVGNQGLLFVGKQSRLKDLRLGKTKITDAGLESLSNLKNIRTLNLNDTFITDDGLTHLSQMTDMRDLSLVNTKIGNEGLANLAKMHHLQRLLLTGTPINGDGLQLIKDLPIDELHVDGTVIRDSDLPVINNLKSLVEIHIGSTKVNGDGLQSLTDLKSLKRLFMSNCPFEDKNLHFLKQFPNLEEVGAGATHITDAGLAALAQVPTLTAIQINQDNITDAGLKCLIQMPQLEKLSVEKTHVTDEGFRDIGKLKKLRELDVAGTDITDVSLVEFGKLPKLRKLNIKYCHQLTAAAAEEFHSEHQACHLDQ
jgi:serine/threonine protein kinase